MYANEKNRFHSFTVFTFCKVNRLHVD